MGWLCQIKVSRSCASSTSASTQTRSDSAESIHEATYSRKRSWQYPAPTGTFDLDVSLTPPVETVAVWLSSDGDDTGSAFTVLVERITLSTAIGP